MLTIEDINKLVEVMKNFSYTKEEIDEKFDNVNEKFSHMFTIVDA